ncbi:MAG: diguanylate cyclase, partial [Acidobacteriaceae bacterium]|nr:diguanylate cyclase [Acidobacteriaceae bacterium]
ALRNDKQNSVPVTSDAGEELHFSVSIGIAASFPDDGDIFAVIARADRNLYAAKEQGRNRVA